MAVAITATLQNVYPPRVLVSVTGLTLTNEVQLYRSVGGELTALRGGYTASATDTSFLVTDAELPFGVPVIYQALVNGTTTYSTSAASYTLTGSKVALSDAISGLSAEVVVASWDAKNSSRDSSTFRVGGRNVVVSGELGQPTSSLELFVEAYSSTETLRTLLDGATEAIIQIRQPGGYDGVDSYLAVLGASEQRFSVDGSDERRIWVLEVVEVEGWAPELETRGYTLQDIADAYTGLTLADLDNDFATLLEVAQAEF